MDVNGCAARCADDEIAARPRCLGVFVESDNSILRVLSLDVQTELVVGDNHFLFVHAAADKHAGNLAVAVIRTGVDAFLDGHVIAVSVGRNHNVVVLEMLRDFRNLLFDEAAGDFRYLTGAFSDGVRVVVLAGGNHEICPGGFVAQAFQPVQRCSCHVQKHHSLFIGHRLHRSRIILVAIAVQAILLEPAAGNRGEQNGNSALLTGFIDEQAQIILVRAPSIGISCRIAFLRVVVAELDEHIIPRLDGFVYLSPSTLIDETLGALAVACVIDHFHSAVQEVLEHHAPAALLPRLGKVLLRHSAVPHQMDGETAAENPNNGKERDSSTSSE